MHNSTICRTADFMQKHKLENQLSIYHATLRSRHIPGLVLPAGVTTGLVELPSSPPAPLFSRCRELPSVISLVTVTSHWCIGGLHTATDAINIRCYSGRVQISSCGKPIQMKVSPENDQLCKN